MIYYAIRHIPTGRFLPASKRKRGFTWDEPTNLEDSPPRLFTKSQHADSALREWLYGQQKGVGYTNHYGESDYDVTTYKVESRKKEDMHVVKIQLRIVI